MRDLKNLLQLAIEERVGDESTVALLLSGGVDSLSLGFAAEALGKTVHAYTFLVDGFQSEDMRVSRKAAKMFGWEFTPVIVPTNRVQDDFLELAKKWKCVKKTQYECTWPFLYILPEIKEMCVLSGIAADGHFGLSKKAMIHHKYPKDVFDQSRIDYFNSPNPAGQVQQKALIESFGKRQIAPYLDSRIFDYFIKLDWDQINRPVQKIRTLQAYPEQFKAIGRRPHQNLQCGSGVIEAFSQILDTDLNKKNRIRVMDMCRDYAEA